MIINKLPRDKEVFNYMNEDYILDIFPLDSFLEKNDYIIIKENSDKNPGYIASWRMETNKLYLSNLICKEYTFADIFITNEPVLADWFSGTIKIGIGDSYQKRFGPFILTLYENYLWIIVENGIVSERKIQTTEKFSDFELKFGKYKNRNVLDLINGKINKTNSVEKLCKDYVQEIINFILIKEYNKKIISPFFKPADKSKNSLSFLRNNNINYLLTNNLVAIEKQINGADCIETENMSILLEQIITSDFKRTWSINPIDFPNCEIEENTFLINPDINYINWAVEHVDNFCIAPHILENIKELKFLSRFEINRLNSTVFEYKPVIENIKINLLKNNFGKINRTKFENLFKVKYSLIDQTYFYDLTDKVLYNKFGYYLDENFKDESDDYYEDFSDNDSNNSDIDRDYFWAMTDGQLGDYDDFIDEGGNIDDIGTWAGN